MDNGGGVGDNLVEVVQALQVSGKVSLLQIAPFHRRLLRDGSIRLAYRRVHFFCSGLLFPVSLVSFPGQCTQGSNSPNLKQGSRIHFVNGMKAYRQLDFVAAQQAFARGLEREPDNTSARISYARALYLANEKERSRKELETVLAEQPSNALAGYLLGVMAEEEGDAETASKLYLRAIYHEPGHPGASLQLGNLSYRQGRR